MSGDPTEEGESKYGMIAMIGAGCMAFTAIIGMIVVQTQGMSTHYMCYNNLYQLSVAMTTYTSTNNNQFPEANTFVANMHASASGAGSALRCPECVSGKATDYVYLGHGLNLKDLKRPASTIILHDEIGNHKGFVNCVYADGNVQQIDTKATTWEEFRKERLAAKDVILNEPPSTQTEDRKELPTYQ